MNILDALIIIFLILGIMAGLRRGFIKQIVLLVGLIAILVISFYLKNPVATFLYKHLPFFKFSGIFKGVSILNILIYNIRYSFILSIEDMLIIARMAIK